MSKLQSEKKKIQSLFSPMVAIKQHVKKLLNHRRGKRCYKHILRRKLKLEHDLKEIIKAYATPSKQKVLKRMQAKKQYVLSVAIAYRKCNSKVKSRKLRFRKNKNKKVTVATNLSFI
jgi:hypothetical protein